MTMKRLSRLLLALLIALPALALGVLWLGFQDRALVSREIRLSAEQVNRARWILAVHDPRRIHASERRAIVVGEEDLGLVVRYGAERLLGGGAEVRLARGTAIVRVTIDTGANPLGRYLNFEARLRETAKLPRLESLRLGRVPVPARLAEWVLGRMIAERMGADAAGAIEVIERVRFAERRIAVIYQWNETIAGRIRAAVYPPGELDRLRAYHEKLVVLTRELAARPDVPLGDVLAALLQEASRRANGGDPVIENRALLLALGLYAIGRSPAVLAPDARAWPRPHWVRISLNGREDLAQHFAASAAMAANAGSAFSDAIGLYKEVADAQGGSGFSFTDLAADRAGTRFGELATASRAKASALHATARAGLAEGLFMPRTDDLPEFLQQAEFNGRFGGVGGSGYNRLKDDIERRLGALELYR